jgi:hypothetical protein
MFSSENKNTASNEHEGYKIESNPYYSSPDLVPQDHSKIFIEWTNKQVVTDPEDATKTYLPFQITETFVIQSDEEFHMALARFNEIIDAEGNAEEASELGALEKAIDKYWDILYPKESES